jgi:hypothetical protein
MAWASVICVQSVAQRQSLAAFRRSGKTGLAGSHRSRICSSEHTMQNFRRIIEAFADQPMRRPAARSFSEEGEILSESLIRILAGLNRNLDDLLRVASALKPYLGKAKRTANFRPSCN